MARHLRPNLEAVAESIPHIVWLSTPDGSTAYLNKIGIDYTGLSREAHYASRWVQLVHVDDVARALLAWEQATSTVTRFEAEYRIRRHDGAYRWHSCRALPVRGRRGRVVGWLGTAIDIHDARDAAQRLRALERQITHGQVPCAAAELQGEEDERAAARREECAEIDLSPGEADVVRLVALGHTNREVAQLIGVSLRTVEARRGRAMSKLGVKSRADLVRRASEAGLLDRP